MLQTHWILVFRDQLSRRIIGFGVQAVAVDVACSTRPFPEKACPGGSVPIMIRCSSSTASKPICGFWARKQCKRGPAFLGHGGAWRIDRLGTGQSAASLKACMEGSAYERLQRRVGARRPRQFQGRHLFAKAIFDTGFGGNRPQVLGYTLTGLVESPTPVSRSQFCRLEYANRNGGYAVPAPGIPLVNGEFLPTPAGIQKR